MAEEQDPLTAARETLAGMTPGVYRWYDAREDDPTCEPPFEVFVRHKSGIAYAHKAKDAAGIVLSVSIARALTDEATVEAVARALAERDVYEGYDKPTRARLVQFAMERRRREVRLSILAILALANTPEPTP